MTHRITERPGWPETAAFPDGAELLDRWEVLLARVPRLRPWLGQMLGRHRLLLQERMEPAEIERTLWRELARWLQQFEALPRFAVGAIATTLQNDERERAPVFAQDEAPTAVAESPERAVIDLEALLADPAFTLAFHCIEARLRPQLAAAIAPSLCRVPEEAWFGLLHASAPSRALLTAEVAVALVLRVRSAGWANVPPGPRKAALRLFLANLADLRGQSEAALQRLATALPAEWRLPSSGVRDFVAAAGRARVGFADASGLCARIVASLRGPRSGGLASLQDQAAGPASAAELAELAQTARKYARIAGFQRLLALI